MSNVSAWISWKLQTTHMTKDSGSPGSIPWLSDTHKNCPKKHQFLPKCLLKLHLCIYIYTISQNHGNASWMFNQMDKSQSSATVLSKNLPPLFFDFTTLNPKMSKNVPITLQGAVTIQSIANRLWFARPTILPLLVSRRFHPRERPRPFPRFFLIQRLRRSKCGLKRKKKTVKCY